MKKYLFYTFVFLATTTTVYGQNSTYSATVNSSSGQNYSVNIEIELTDIVPVQSSCDWGYNYDVAYDYDIQINGNNSNLYTLAGYLTCGSNPGIYFDLPNNGGSGSSVTQGNPWNSNSDCATATVASLMCDSISIQIEGPGIPNQFIALELNNNEDNGDDQDWGMDGNNADTTSFIGTTNANPLVLRTNNQERMRITEDGNIGIGIINPEKELDVEGDIRLSGDLTFKGYEDMQDTINRFLTIDKFGKTQVKSLNSLRDNMYTIDCYLTTDDSPVSRGVVGLTLPSWANRIADEKQILYTGLSCPTWVGIGTNLPETTLDVRGDGRFTFGLKVGNDFPAERTGLYIKNRGLGNNHMMFENLILVKDHDDRKLLQLNNDGLLRAREIKVDLDTWPDYVFHKDYPLMPLNEVKAFIDANGHLPNVSSAKEIEADGVNLGEAAKTSMEKIEELTLYVIDLDEKLENQELVLSKQQELLQQQQETIRLQQELILELKQLTNKK
ncbi:MAG TPA: hypothetical protein VKY37_03320 [Brumimicrobium sp.]|nr:hypothetical protein [Brumimicrobium sp.]